MPDTITLTDREQALSDLLCTALCGGIGYWVAVSEYRMEGPADEQGATLAAWEESDPEAGVTLPLRVTLADLAKAARTIVATDPEEGQPDGYRFCSQDALANCALLIAGRFDDIDFDAGTADEVFQVAVFGKTIFG